MKRALTLILCAAMLLSCTLSFSACTTLKKLSDGTYDKGAVIDLYIGSEVYDFDPALNFTDSEMVKLLSMIYEGLTTLDAKGRWQNAMMESYSVGTDKMNGDTLLTIQLKDTRWSDGRTVQASDFMYAWKRLLDPDFRNEAAALLFDIKNAKSAKAGDCSIDDVGITCPETYVLEIRFDKDRTVNMDRFFETLASVALVPLREDVVSKGDWWAKKMTSLVTNGSFAVKELSFGGTLRLERNPYYCLSQAEDSREKLDKYVIPYRLITHYSLGSLEDQLSAYEAGLLYYLGEIPVDARSKYKDDAVVTDEMNTLSCYFNLENTLLSDVRVRQALSLAVDRSDLASKLVFAKAATGLISNGVFDTTNKTSFREEAGSVIASGANRTEAESLLNAASSAGALSRGTVTLTVRASAEDTINTNDQLFVAEYLAGAWNELLSSYGVTVEVRRLNTSPVEVAGAVQLYLTDDFQEAYENQDFDILLCDVAMLSTDAFSTLAPYALRYSGNGINMDSADYTAYPHMTGYNSAAYNELMDQIYAEADASKRADLLHQAEKLLLEDLPVMPLVFTEDAYLINDGVLKKVDTTYTGAMDFKDTRMKNYMSYKENYDTQPLQVFSDLVALIMSTNEYDRTLEIGCFWTPYLSEGDFTLLLTLDQVAQIISGNTSTGTTLDKVLPKLKSLCLEKFKLDDLDVDGSKTLCDLAIAISGKIS